MAPQRVMAASMATQSTMTIGGVGVGARQKLQPEASSGDTQWQCSPMQQPRCGATGRSAAWVMAASSLRPW